MRNVFYVSLCFLCFLLVPSLDVSATTDSDDVQSPVVVDNSEIIEDLSLQIVDLQSQLQDQAAVYASGTANVYDAYLSTTIAGVFSSVLESEPFPYYLAFRPSSDGNEGRLVYSSYRPNVTSSAFIFRDCYVCHYYRKQYGSGSSTYYVQEYTVDQYSTYTVYYQADQLIYTNCISGYPALIDRTLNVQLLFIFLSILAVLFLRRRVSHV